MSSSRVLTRQQFEAPGGSWTLASDPDLGSASALNVEW